MRKVVAAIITREPDNKILICQRRKDQPLALKWEFPGGKIEPGEHLTTFEHHYKNGGGVELTFFRVLNYAGEMKNIIFKDIRWVDRRSLPRFDFLEADVKLVREIAAGNIF
jgi:8-oxo-dGTP diphosphatase